MSGAGVTLAKAGGRVQLSWMSKTRAPGFRRGPIAPLPATSQPVMLPVLPWSVLFHDSPGPALPVR
jgi:hypothetical protein